MDENEYIQKELYQPINQKYYKYTAIENLNKDMNAILKQHNTININIIPYEINNDIKYPFVKYLLKNNRFFGFSELNFVKINQFKTLYLDTNDIVLHTKSYLYNLLLLDDVELKDKMEYKGFYFDSNNNNNNSNNLYIFYNITKINIQLNDIYLNSKLWFCILDEIMNENHVCNIVINDGVKNLFIDNFEFCFLYDENGDRYSLPWVGYVNREGNNLNFTYIFGVSASDKNAILGPYYYFTSYSNALNQIDKLKEINKSKLSNKNMAGVVRFAIYVDNVKYIHNFPNDPIDESSIKSEILQDENIDRQSEVLTMRISDHDGLWTDEYDSAFIGKIELDNGKLLENTPILVVKNYEQQQSLSYHYV